MRSSAAVTSAACGWGFMRRKYMPKGKHDTKTSYCAFCGKSQHEVKKLIAGPAVFICNECVELCMTILREGKLTSE